jgi:hypothetical protein
MRFHASIGGVLLITLVALADPASAQSKHLAPGFSALALGSKVAIMPTDIELFSISAGGVLEPKADWTAAASQHFKNALIEKKKKALKLDVVEVSETDADEFADINALHGAIARAISMHHFGAGSFNLPTKDGKLDWSLGEATRAIKKATGADYALFTWVRDSYASGERIATMIALAVLGVGVGGGMQIGYASLVELETGQVLWFNQLQRASGDLREAEKAAETIDTLLGNFPAPK